MSMLHLFLPKKKGRLCQNPPYVIALMMSTHSEQSILKPLLFQKI